MKQLLTGKQMKQADTWSIKEFGMESLILMERAAPVSYTHLDVYKRQADVFSAAEAVQVNLQAAERCQLKSRSTVRLKSLARCV